MRSNGFCMASNTGHKSDLLGLSVAKAEEVQVVAWMVRGALGL